MSLLESAKAALTSHLSLYKRLQEKSAAADKLSNAIEMTKAQINRAALISLLQRPVIRLSRGTKLRTSMKKIYDSSVALGLQKYMQAEMLEDVDKILKMEKHDFEAADAAEGGDEKPAEKKTRSGTLAETPEPRKKKVASHRRWGMTALNDALAETLESSLVNGFGTTAVLGV